MRRSASAPIASCDLERIDWAVIHHDFRIEFWVLIEKRAWCGNDVQRAFWTLANGRSLAGHDGFGGVRVLPSSASVNGKSCFGSTGFVSGCFALSVSTTSVPGSFCGMVIIGSNRYVNVSASRRATSTAARRMPKRPEHRLLFLRIKTTMEPIMCAARTENSKPPQNPIDFDGLTDLGPAQPKNPPHRANEDAELRDPPSPAGVPSTGANEGQR
ncbi:hypothetical protein [Caballeronia sp. ATUFL_F1_KS4A]|uniref:hypothetical protein n=2 Tax=Caballeronia TaxID=1827195 RepID=UPI002028CA47|nr:hypothetical protein [Caballeronia sp. ATUFL_F1_KS4A]